MKVLNRLVSKGHLGMRNQQRFSKHLPCDFGCWGGLRATLGAHDCYVLYDKKKNHYSQHGNFLEVLYKHTGGLSSPYISSIQIQDHFFAQIFIEVLLSARISVKCWEYGTEKVGVASGPVDVCLVQLLLRYTQLVVWLRSWMEKLLSKVNGKHRVLGEHREKTLTWVLGIRRTSWRKQ